MIIVKSDYANFQIILGYIGNRKRPSLALKNGTSLRILGSFYSEETMTEFADALVELSGKEDEDEKGEEDNIC